MKSKQAGGIVSFIIVAVALTGLLAGGLYLSKQQGRTARESDTSTPQVTTVQGDNKQNTEEKGSNATEEETAQPAPQTNSGTAQNQPQPAPSNSGNRGAATPNSTNTRTDRVATTGPSSVPATGPTETAAVGLGLGALVFTGYRFAQSRRALRTSALRQ